MKAKVNRLVYLRATTKLQPVPGIRYAYPWLLFVLLTFGLSGCSYEKKNVLFKLPKGFDMEGAPVYRLSDNIPSKIGYEHKIRPDDRVSIRFLNNYEPTSGITLGTMGDEVSFLVDKNGFVALPMIGRVKVAGMTRSQAATFLEQKYSTNLKNPVIEVNILNIGVSVMGEIKREGFYPLTKEKTYLPEVLAAAGGVTPYGKLKQVRIFRGDLKDPEIIIFDLTQIDALKDEQMLLQSGDIIYIEPRNYKLFSDSAQPVVAFISLFTSLATLTVVAFSTFRNNK